RPTLGLFGAVVSHAQEPLRSVAPPHPLPRLRVPDHSRIVCTNEDSGLSCKEHAPLISPMPVLRPDERLGVRNFYPASAIKAFFNLPGGLQATLLPPQSSALWVKPPSRRRSEAKPSAEWPTSSVGLEAAPPAARISASVFDMPGLAFLMSS